MKNAPRAVVVLLFAVALSACGRLEARTEPVRPPLDTPPPPAHLIEAMIADVEPVDLPAEKPAEKPAEGPPKPPARVVARPALSGAEERATSSPPPADTPQYSLQTTAKVTEAERRIRVQLVQAAQDLSRTNYGALSAEAQAQYDIARRFAQQAEEALKNRNLVFAGQLADKAAELAGILSNR